MSSNASHLLHTALSSGSSPVARNPLGSPSGLNVSPKGHQSPGEQLNCAPLHSVTKVRNWTPNTRQPLNTLNTIECHSNHSSLISTSVNSSTTLTAQPIHGQHPSNGCNYYNNRCVSTSSSPLSSSSSTLSYGRRQRYSTQMTSRSSPSNPSLPPTVNFCYRTSPTDNFGSSRTAQQNTCVSTQESLATTKFFSNPNIANGGNSSIYSSHQSSQSTQPLQQRSHYFTTDYNCDYSGARSEPQTYPQRQTYENPYIDNSAQQGPYATNGGTGGTVANYANPTNYANLVSQANQIPDPESYGSENNAIQSRAQPNANSYTNAGYYELGVNSSDQNCHRIPSEYNAIALKQQPNEYSSQSQLNSAHQHQYYDIQNSGTGLAVAVSPNIPNTFDQNYCNSNSSDPTATCYNTYNNSNYYDVYNNCTSGLTNNEFNFINIANEFASPEYYQLS